jgi:hypothetical protein
MPIVDDATLRNILPTAPGQGGTHGGSSSVRAPDGVAQDVYETHAF